MSHKKRFQGPVRPGRDVEKFRRTGRSTPLFQGPVRPGRDVEKFRRTGRSTRVSSPVYGPTRKEFEAKKNRKAIAKAKALKEQQAKAKTKALKEQQTKKLQLAKITRGERLSAIAREEVRRAAIIRGKPFTRIQTQSFIRSRGGSIGELRSARRKGFVVERRGVGATMKDVSKKREEEKVNLKSAGLIPLINNSNQVIGFKSNITNKKYNYTKSGIAKFKKDIKLLKNKGSALITKYTSDISTIENSLKASAKRGDIQRLANLQRKNRLTASERIEKQRLQKVVANNYKKVSNMVALTIAKTILSLGVGSVDLAIALRKDPVGTMKSIPPNVWISVKQDFARAKGSSTGALNVAVEYATLGGILKGIGKVTGSTIRTVSKIKPSYVKEVGGKFVLRKEPTEILKVRGRERLLKARVQRPSIKRPFSSVSDFIKGRKPGQFKKFTRDPGLILRKQTVATGASPLSAQARLAGQEVTAVNAAAMQLTSWIRRKQIIRKPIPGEANFPIKIKNLLKKFDSGKSLATREFAEVNLWLQKNVAPNITLLERSLYLDPTSGLRISRLGIQPTRTATFRDILRGNFRLWNAAGKPQVLIFENAKVTKFPKSLDKIKRKLLANKQLTATETNQLIRWQVQTGSGKFKPIGSTIYNKGKELEITLAPGEMIKRIKQVGFTFINGKKVTFVTAKIFKPTKILSNQIKKANQGKLSKTQLSSLEKSLSKKLGRRVRIETPTLRKISQRDIRRADQNIPVLRIRGSGIFASRLIRTNVRRRSPKRLTKRDRTISARPGRPTVKSRSSVRRKPIIRTKSSQRRTARRVSAIRRGGKKSSAKPPIILRIPETFTRKTLSKSQPTFYVVEKVRGRFKKLFPKPLTKKDARDYAVYSIDNHLSKTAFFIPLGNSRKVVSPPKPIQNYYAKNNRKVRPYRIRFGRRKQLVNGYIEKRKYFQDTAGEKRQLSIARKKATFKHPKRKLTAAQKKVLIQRLKKARMARLRNLRKKK